MSKIVHKDIAKKLGEIWKLQELITGEYLNNSENKAFQEIVKKFYPWEEARAKILNPWSYIASIVYDWEKSFFGNPSTQYNIDWSEFIIGILTTSEARLKINVDTLELESIDASTYYFDWKTEYFLKLFEKEFENWTKQKFVMLETFHKKVFLRKLFKVTGFDSISDWDEVPLSYIDDTKELSPALTIDLDRLVISKKVGLEKIKMIETIIYSIERKIAHNDHTIMDYGDVWTIIKNMDISHARVDPNDENSAIDMDKLWKILITESGSQEWIQPGIEIVKNTYESIDASLKIIDGQLMQISSITWIPSYAFISNIRLGNDSWKAKDKASTIFYKKIEWYHSVVRDIFEKFWERISTPEEERVLEFQEIITTSTKDKLEIEDMKIENERKKVENGFSTREMAVMNIHSVDEWEAKNILKQIENDKIAQNQTADGTENKE